MAVIDQQVNSRYAIYNADCVDIMRSLPDASVGLSVYSPPFCGLYQYSSSERDLSNARSYEEFFEHYDYVISEIAQLTMPGRLTAVHCMDVPKDGANLCCYTDFPGDIIRLHERHGFEYLPRICIWKEPLEVRNRTMSKSLAHCQIIEDSTLTSVAAADYLIPFRKKGKNPAPVVHPVGLLDYAGERTPPTDILRYRGYKGDQTKNRFSHWIWRKYASSVWDDIRLHRVLPYVEARDPEDDRHMHPLQLDVIERCLIMWSNPGDIVFTPFMGVGSEVYGSLTCSNGPRRGVGVELKPSYYRQAVKNMAEAHEVKATSQQPEFAFSTPEDRNED